jgi:hypothetical protein
MYWQKRTSKYGAKSATYNGHTYHSMREANYAADLDLRVRAGELKEWRRQVPIDLIVNGVKVCMGSTMPPRDPNDDDDAEEEEVARVAYGQNTSRFYSSKVRKPSQPPRHKREGYEQRISGLA